MAWRRVVQLGAAGLVLGLLGAFFEVLHLSLFVRGVGFRPVLLLYGGVVDGGAGLLVGLVAGVLWGVIEGRRRINAVTDARKRILRSAQDDVESHSPGAQVRIIWRGYGPAPAARPALVSRRNALRLGVAAASVGAAGIGGLALAARMRREPAAYAYNLVSDNAGGSGASASAVPSQAASAAPSLSAAAAPPPNILLVTVDTVRADQLGVYGHPYMKTPALDKLASQGARFDLHLVQEPATNPSHASMFSGMYPSSNGVVIHMVDKLKGSVETLAGVLQRAGYSTAGLYSWLSLDPQYCDFQRGFDVYQNVAGASVGALNSPLARQAAADYRVAEQYLGLAKQVSEAAGVQQDMEWKDKGHADVTTQAAISQLQQMKGPFFLWVHYFDPHYPYVPPTPYDTQYDSTYSGSLTFDVNTIQAIEKGQTKPNGDDVRRLMSLYQGAISFVDSQLGQLATTLDSMGLTGNTLFAVTADHGESFGEHAQLTEDTDFFHPHDLFNTEQRTPLLLRYPSRIKPGTVVAAPTQAIDLFPTLLEFAGLKAPDQSQGASLWPLLNGQTNGADRIAFSSMPDYVFTSVTVPGWKYIVNNASGTSQVFDLAKDPAETRDVSAAHPNVTKLLAAKAYEWMKAEKIS